MGVIGRTRNPASQSGIVLTQSAPFHPSTTGFTEQGEYWKIDDPRMDMLKRVYASCWGRLLEPVVGYAAGDTFLNIIPISGNRGNIHPGVAIRHPLAGQHNRSGTETGERSQSAMDKRERPRILVSLEITYESGDDFVSSFLSDISGGGLFIGTSNPMGVNTRLKVCFHVPGISESLLATGTVAWVRDSASSDKPGMGVRFDEMEPGDQEKLDQFFSEHETG